MKLQKKDEFSRRNGVPSCRQLLYLREGREISFYEEYALDFGEWLFLVSSPLIGEESVRREK